jgi:hypothetical protein
MEKSNRTYKPGNNKRTRNNWAERRKRNKGKDGQDNRRDFVQRVYKMDNVKFDLYYRRLLDKILSSGDAKTDEEGSINKDQDFKQFCEHLKQKLPITFRVNPL